MILLPLALMLFLMMIGLPVAFSMGITGIIGIWMIGGLDSVLGILGTSPFRSAAHYTLTTVPLFILMAGFITNANITRDVFQIAYKWFGHLPGGVAIATVFANAGFGAMCGSSTASAAAMSSVVVPEMQRLKYKDEIIAGSVAVAGTLAVLIPPSVPMIIYGTATETSVGKLLIAGIVPGIIATLIMALNVVVWVKLKPGVSPHIPPFPWSERIESLLKIFPMVVLFALVIGSIYSGLATPTESAAIGALGALLVSLGMGRLSKDGIYKAIVSTLNSTGTIFILIICATVFGYYLTMSQIPQSIVQIISSLEVNRWLIMLLLIVLYLILGCIMDQIAILMLTLPMVFPVVQTLGFDPVWFGVIVIVLVEMGLVTPPVGLNVFIVSSVGKIPLGAAFRGSAVLLISCAISMIIFLLFPEIVLWLPNRM
ncbi:MAG: TRAP transporter large permease [Acidaminococcales bacterium]|jgi:tripartite ATP-independent transporter DctM subunit|nr:TRAP transporter large permease [Acidaminococcales bacterium]